MSTVAFLTTRRPVLADAVPGARARDVALVIGGAGLTALGAQISIHVSASPVPITGQTLGVVIAGAALGVRRGALSQLLYLVAGLILPVYAAGTQGWHVFWGASGGYIVGFALAGAAIGWLSERGADRRLLSAFAMFAIGQLLIFGVGVPWLAVAAHLDVSQAIHEGFTIFIVGGLIKAALAGLLTPWAWRAVRRLDAR